MKLRSVNFSFGTPNLIVQKPSVLWNTAWETLA
jgi:hypothetical protein